MPRNPTLGAVLIVGGVDRTKVGLGVNYIMAMGGNCQPKGKIELRREPQAQPQQLHFKEIFTQTPYDETSHLRPNGKRRR
ncbi:MAG: hypothetical protein NZ893_02905 [Candidatus Aenigmarchaeota archaeon]|nr:hypothetical protein [Candidatus Aenigmarchaeota archaeon]